MKILNDSVHFDAADFDGLSDVAKKALSVYLEDYAAFFSASVNREIERAQAHANSLRNQNILAGLGNADEKTKLEAESLLTQLDVLLAPKPEPEPVVVVEEIKSEPEVITEVETVPSFFDKVKSFFS